MSYTNDYVYVDINDDNPPRPLPLTNRNWHIFHCVSLTCYTVVVGGVCVYLVIKLYGQIW